jgi:hypothetical protein
VTLRLVYLIFCQLSAWIALLMRSEGSKTAEILVLRHQVSVWVPETARAAGDLLLGGRREAGMIRRWHFG